MQLVEVKNDLAKILYSPVNNPVLPSDFLLIDDVNQKLICQIINVETTENPDNNLAVLRLVLSIDKEDNLSLYNGYIPSKNSEVLYINPDEILELIKGSGESVYFGELANHSLCYVKPSVSFINDRLYIQSDREDKTKIVIQNLVYELKDKNKKILLIDFDGRYSDLSGAAVVKLSHEFKLPLNSDGLDNILENDIADCSIDDKAVIQSIILELKEYLASLEDKYIPFTVFKNAVDDVFLSNPVSGLMLFRNKLWRYSQSKLFAEKKEDYEIINSYVAKSSVVVADISEMDECSYKYALRAIMNLIKDTCYMIVSLDSIELDKKSVIGLYKRKNILPVVCTAYDSKYSQILKSLCSNQLLCKPAGYFGEDEKYAGFLNKINTSSMILYGEATLYLPLIVNLNLFNAATNEDVLDNEIKKDVDKLLTSSKSIISPETITDNLSAKNDEMTDECESVDEEDDDVLDSDLDFLDELNNEESIQSEINNIPAEDVLNESCIEKHEYDVFSPSEEVIAADNVIESTAEKDYEENLTAAETRTEDETENEAEIQAGIVTSEETDAKTAAENVPQATAESEPEFDTEPDTDEILAKENNDEELQSIDDIIDSITAEDIKDLTAEDAEIKQKTEEKPVQNDVVDTSVSMPYAVAVNDNNVVKTVSESAEIIDSDSNQNIPGRPVVKTDNTVDIEYVTEEHVSDIIKQKDINITAENTPEMDYVDEEDIVVNKKEYKTNDFDTEDCSEMQCVEDVVKKNEEPEKEIEEPAKEIEKPQINENINTKKSETLPVYETDTSSQLGLEDLPFKTGDIVYHPKHGRGVIEGFTNYSNKILFCQIEFENVGRRILDPRIAGIEKVEE